MTIKLKADRVTVDVNGRAVLKEVPLPQTKYFGELPQRGPLGLQAHGRGCCVEFRGLYVRPLSPPPPD